MTFMFPLGGMRGGPKMHDVCMYPSFYLESHVTDRGHGIHRGTSGALSVGLRLLWP